MRKSIFLFLITAALWNSNLYAETYYFQAPAEGEFATELSSAIINANNGDEFILTSPGSVYAFNELVTVSVEITIKGSDANNQPILKQGNENINSIIQIVNSGTLSLTSVILNGERNTINLDYGISVISDNENTNNYTLKLRNCIFDKLNGVVISAGVSTMGDNILFENCYFNNTSSIDFNLKEEAKEASFSKIEFQSCVFNKCDSGAFYLNKKASGLHGDIIINHCTFDSVSRTTPEKILSLEGANSVNIINSVFSNSNTNPTPFNLQSSATLDYCDFYRCADIGSSTGANCLYYNPQYDNNFFVTNPSLAGRGNDGKNIGPLAWFFSDDDQDIDTIDKGDNPHNFQNQGVWIVPQQDSSGSWESYFLKYDKNGKLKYRSDSMGDIIPDFSQVGYKRGNESIPNYPVIATINPITNDAADEIQRVIDSVGTHITPDAHGVRGAILIKAGMYSISKQISIPYNGIVLRGEGEGEDGTILTATSTSGSVDNKTKLISLGKPSGSLTKIIASKEEIPVPYIPVGAKYVIVPSGHSYNVGDHICIYQQFNNNWVSDLKMDQIPPDGGTINQWVASDYNYNFERNIERISSGPMGDSIFFYNPIVMALDAKYSTYREVYKCTFARTQLSGVENMQLKSVYRSDSDENHTWNAVYVDRAENCWVKNVTSKHFAYACVNVTEYARLITVTKCSSLSPKSEITGSRRYSFNCDGQTSLFSYCYASEGRHDYITGARVCGPNVFTNCLAENTQNDIGPHHRWAVGTLYDMVVSDGEMNVRDRSSMGTGHGWAGANQVLWNSSAATGICQNPWVSAKNYAIGFTGTYVDYTNFGNRPRGEWEGANVSGLNPASLYIAQKFDRNIYIDFGLLNSELIFINDSTYRLKYNQAVDTLTATTPSNYYTSGSAGIEGNPNEVILIDSVTVELNYHSTGLLDGGLQINIRISEVTNAHSDGLNGLMEAKVTVPHQEPKITMNTQTATNAEGQFVIAKTTKNGDVFLIYIDETPETVNDLEQAIIDNKGAVTRNNEANNDVQISTFQLPSGYYYAYAVDKEGRMSNKSTRSITVEDFLTSNKQNGIDLKPTIYYAVNSISIRIFHHQFNRAKFELFDIKGQLIISKNLYQQENKIDLNISDSIYIARLTIDNEQYNTKVLVTN